MLSLLPFFQRPRRQGPICQLEHAQASAIATALLVHLQSAFLQTRGLLLRLIHSAELWAGMHMLRGICSWGARPANIASGAAPGQARRLACLCSLYCPLPDRRFATGAGTNYVYDHRLLSLRLI